MQELGDSREVRIAMEDWVEMRLGRKGWVAKG